MSVGEADGLITPRVHAAVRTNVANVARATVANDAIRQQWQRLLDQMIEWATNPDQFDEYPAPSGDTIRLAGKLATRLATLSEPAPTHVVVDANGGIVFESRDGLTSESILVSADLKVEYRRFVNGKLAGREQWSLE